MELHSALRQELAESLGDQLQLLLLPQVQATNGVWSPLVVERPAVRRVGVGSIEGASLWPRAQPLEEGVLARLVRARR